jgi:hypothetical protein
VPLLLGSEAQDRQQSEVRPVPTQYAPHRKQKDEAPENIRDAQF